MYKCHLKKPNLMIQPTINKFSFSLFMRQCSSLSLLWWKYIIHLDCIYIRMYKQGIEWNLILDWGGGLEKWDFFFFYIWKLFFPFIKDPLKIWDCPSKPLPSFLPIFSCTKYTIVYVCIMYITLLQRMWYSITVAICGGIASIFQ